MSFPPGPKYRWRKTKNMGMTVICLLSVLVAIAPLFFIFFYTLSQGLSAINLDFFLQMPKPVGEPGGGMANAIAGTAILLGIGCLISLPFGILTGVYLAEYGNNPFGIT